ncbi:hypothetical protein LSTR_LSTR016986 [Laodelphax striatellus]|uniref:Uncharacterized protein n=1 Tax=Laodelphax striatellus TaxID=195883 RepID=A0A482WVU5_LAOST|nr:hypothetical protein LSTR_LSTR011688 [Laodelphax striatellus]RZF37412.1 hypothetical protein LSTR_LSTR011689 [Laodelphax striatellus]RZF49025.1 hypothetical protein LSTR_LSTR016986 [Laodelphax striatellus]
MFKENYRNNFGCDRRSAPARKIAINQCPVGASGHKAPSNLALHPYKTPLHPSFTLHQRTDSTALSNHIQARGGCLQRPLLLAWLGIPSAARLLHCSALVDVVDDHSVSSEYISAIELVMSLQ